MLFRDELEESGMDKDDMDAAVAEHRAQLLAEAEKELAAAKLAAAATAATEAGKPEPGSSKRSRHAFICLRDAAEVSRQALRTLTIESTGLTVQPAL